MRGKRIWEINFLIRPRGGSEVVSCSSSSNRRPQFFLPFPKREIGFVFEAAAAAVVAATAKEAVVVHHQNSKNMLNVVFH